MEAERSRDPQKGGVAATGRRAVQVVRDREGAALGRPWRIGRDDRDDGLAQSRERATDHTHADRQSAGFRIE